MGRMSSANANQAGKQVFGWVDFVHLDLPGYTVTTTNGPREYPWNGRTYQPDGLLGSVAGYTETADLRGSVLRVVLSGADSSLISAVRSDGLHWSTAIVGIGITDSAMNLVDSPYPYPLGHIVGANIRLGRRNEVTISIASRARELGRVNGLRFSDADQKERYPGDKFFNQMHLMADRQRAWGPEFVGTGGASGGTPNGSRGPQITRARSLMRSNNNYLFSH